jgi:hypothetical protein
LTGGWGAISRQAEDAGCSRQTAYDHAEKVEAAVRDAAGGGPSREQLQQRLRQQAERIAVLEKRLTHATEFPEQEASLRRWWLRRQSAMVAADAPGGGHWLAAALVQTECCRRLAANWEESYRRVAAVVRHTVRASGAVECMNGVLRMHQGRHRTVTQPMLDLKRLYWNCRPFQSGKRRGRCPYELLGLRLPTTDWWELLHTALADSTQELSSSELTI